MSARKIANFSISTLTRRKYFTNSFSKSINERMSSLAALNRCHRQPHQHLPVASYSQALGSLTKDQAHDLVFRLNDEERGILYQTLQNFQIKQEKQSLECEYKDWDGGKQRLRNVTLINLRNAFFTSISQQKLSMCRSRKFLTIMCVHLAPKKPLRQQKTSKIFRDKI